MEQHRASRRPPRRSGRRHTSTGMLAESTRDKTVRAARGAQLVLVHRVLILGGAAYGLREETQNGVRGLLCCAPPVWSVGSQKNDAWKALSERKKKENTMRSWRYMTDSARAANKQTHHTFQRRLQVRKQLTDCTSFQRTMRAHQRLASYVARHHGLPAT